MKNDLTADSCEDSESAYLNLAAELMLTKHQIAKLRNIDKIMEPDNGTKFVLAYLVEHTEPVTPKIISQVMKISSARVAMILNQLEAKNFIMRKPHPNNKKQTIVQILSDGVLQHQKNKEDYTKRTVQFLKALGSEDAAAYVRLQKKIVKIYSK